MIIHLLKAAGLKLLTKGKICSEDITVTPALQHKTATKNGIITPDETYAGLSSVDVNVSAHPVLQGKEITVTENGTVTIIPDSGYEGFSEIVVTVNVASGDNGGNGGNEEPELETLTTPIISLSGDILSITDESSLATGFAILVDGVEKTTMEVN